MVDLGGLNADFKTKIQTSLSYSNINDQNKGIFSLDSAHDFLFDLSLANVTTNYFSDIPAGIPAGVSGEDRYVWYLKQKGIYDNVKYFGVQELKDKTNPSRRFWVLDDTDDLKPFGGDAPNQISKDTGNFIYNVMFKKRDPTKDESYATNKSFLFQTIHDAGKQLINTHMPTVSNHIDSAGTPKRDVKAKNGTSAPSIYNQYNEGADGGVIQDKQYIDSTIMATEGADEDGYWSMSAPTGTRPDPSKPWYHTKYSLLIYSYIRTILGNQPTFDEINQINLFVTNFVWQLTMVFCYLSFSIDERKTGLPWKAIAYLRTIEFTSFDKKGRSPEYIIFSQTNNIYRTFNEWAIELGVNDKLIEGEMRAVSNIWEPPTAPQPWVVTQSICADEIIEHIKDPKLFISSRRDEDAEIVDTNLLPMFAKAQYLFAEETDVHKLILQIIKFSGDTSHMVQTILQLEGFKEERKLANYPKIPRITVLTTLERILSGRMLNYITNTDDIKTEEDVSVLFETGVYLQENDQGRHELLVKRIKENENIVSGDEAPPAWKGVKVKYFGVYVMENIRDRIQSTVDSLGQKIRTITDKIRELPPHPTTTKLNFIWETQNDLIVIPEEVADEALVEQNKILVTHLKDLFEFDDILEQLIKIERVVNIGELVTDDLPTELNELIRYVLYGFQRNVSALARKRKNVPRHTAFDSKGSPGVNTDHQSGELSNLTLNIDHTNPDFNQMLYDVIPFLPGKLTVVKERIEFLLDYLNLSKRIETAAAQEKPVMVELLTLLQVNTFGTASAAPGVSDLITAFWATCSGKIENRGSTNWYLNSTDNLLILSDQFRQMESSQPFVLYQNNVKNKVSSMQELSKYINEFNKVTTATEEELAVKKQELNQMLKGYISFEEFFADFFKYPTSNDFSGLINLIRFFVNSGEHASLMSKRGWPKNYEIFKDNADEVINILEKLNTLAPAAPQINNTADPMITTPASQINNTADPMITTAAPQSGYGRKGPLRNPALKKTKKTKKPKKPKKTKKNKKHSKNKSKKKKILQYGGAGGSERGATNPVNQSNILIELLKNIKTAISNTSNNKLKEAFYRTQIIGLLANSQLSEKVDGKTENEVIKYFIKTVYDLVSQVDTLEVLPATIDKLLAKFYYIKLSHKDTSSFVEIFSKENTSPFFENQHQRIHTSMYGITDVIRLGTDELEDPKLQLELFEAVEEVTYVQSGTYRYYYDWINSKVTKADSKGEEIIEEDDILTNDEPADSFTFLRLLQYQIESYIYYLAWQNGEEHYGEEHYAATQEELKDSEVPWYTDRITRSIQKQLDADQAYAVSMYKILFLDDKIAEDLAVLATDPRLDDDDQVVVGEFLWDNLDYIYGVYLFDIIKSWLLLKKEMLGGGIMNE